MSVAFATKPERMQERDLGYWIDYHKFQAEGWRAGQASIRQAAFCICRDFRIDPKDVGRVLQVEAAAGGSRRQELPGVGAGVLAYIDKPASQRKYTQAMSLDARPNCAVLQEVTTPTGSDGGETQFFSSLTPVEAKAGPAPGPARSAAERLRQLDQLLKDGLISRDEYNTRRSVIVDSL